MASELCPPQTPPGLMEWCGLHGGDPTCPASAGMAGWGPESRAGGQELRERDGQKVVEGARL